MAEKKDFVKSVTFRKEFAGNFGTIYYFDIEMLNGDKGQYGAKSREQQVFVEGLEVEYDITTNDKGYVNIKPIIRKNTTPGAGGKFSSRQPTPDEYKFKQALIVAQSASRVVMELCVAGKMEFKDFDAAVDKLMEKEIALAEKFKNRIPYGQ